MGTWILGAPDPEMAAIESILRASGEHVLYACLGGTRVTSGTAYRADGLQGVVVSAYDVLIKPDEIYFVECDVAGILPAVVVIDHHRPGDPGHGVPPAEFWRGSSLGQVVHVLAGGDDEVLVLDGILDYGHLRYIAAADHCLAAAYRGECPDVLPDALMVWRVKSRARQQGRTEAAILADIKRAREMLISAPVIALREPVRCHCCGEPQGYCQKGNDALGMAARGVYVRDLRGCDVPELPDAAAREGLAFIATPRPGPDGKRKVVLQVAGPEELAAWPEWAAQNGIVDLYGGDPARGFAGGYMQGT